MNTDELKRWALENSIEEVALRSFWVAFDNYSLDCPNEINKYFGIVDKNKMSIVIKKIALIMDWKDCEDSYVSIRMPIIYNDNEIGYYELMVKLSGQIFDDYLVVDGFARI